MAMKNAEKKFFLIGLTERLNDTIKLLEVLAPDVFKGLEHFYHDELGGIHRNKGKRHIALSPPVEDVLRSRMANEVVFYNFIRQLFERKMKFYASNSS